MSFKSKLEDLRDAASELAAEAATLDNKNLSDILALGVSRFGQALEHPDVDRVGASPEPAPVNENDTPAFPGTVAPGA